MLRRLALTAAALALASSGKAQIETGLSATYRVNVTSWSDLPFHTVVRQRYDFSCGSAALATLLTYHYDRPTPEQQAFGWMWNKGDRAAIRRLGFSMLDIKNFLDAAGLKTEGFRLSVADIGRIGRPGIVILNLAGYKHFVVVKGITADQVLVGDPMLGLNRYSLREFASYWNGIYLTILDRPGHRQPRFNAIDEWRLWSRAPTGFAAHPSPIATITDNLPPVYQISRTVLAVQAGRAAR